MTGAIDIYRTLAPETRPTVIGRALRRFPDVPPALLAARKLQRRTDSKFVLPVADVADLLIGQHGHYAAMRVPSGAVATYRSLYFDTPELTCFHDHRRGRRRRYKVRVRHYPDRALSFFEVKSKQSARLTVKHRLQVGYGSEHLGRSVRSLLSEHVGALAEDLSPTAYIHYRRVSLVGIEVPERVTIDFDLEVSSPGGRPHRFGALAVVEVKQPHLDRGSPMVRALARRRIPRQSMSKYVAAIAATQPAVRRNRLLPALRAVERTEE